MNSGKSELGGSGIEGLEATGDEDFKTLFVTHPTPMWVYDPETLGFLTVNDSAMKLYG